MKVSGRGCQSSSYTCLLYEHGKLLPIMAHIKFEVFHSVVLGLDQKVDVDGSSIRVRLVIRR